MQLTKRRYYLVHRGPHLPRRPTHPHPTRRHGRRARRRRHRRRDQMFGSSAATHHKNQSLGNSAVTESAEPGAAPGCARRSIPAGDKPYRLCSAGYGTSPDEANTRKLHARTHMYRPSYNSPFENQGKPRRNTGDFSDPGGELSRRDERTGIRSSRATGSEYTAGS
ncbi:hypothetical protein IEQ34_017805 [Dendrobium chrysotoxum]|uniref:Uncharacterized protein n=1 Tax=Dendrobium chrysotoxum TaxID=161865 RepID=A0AAV7GAM4_DENCH|nr:hypothetical protein IEQ34_017805 [Dendrobium chrysotoxum]